MHASQIQGCVVEQRVEKKRKIAESVWVYNVVTVWTGKVLASVQCLTPRWRTQPEPLIHQLSTDENTLFHVLSITAI